MSLFGNNSGAGAGAGGGFSFGQSSQQQQPAQSGGFSFGGASGSTAPKPSLFGAAAGTSNSASTGTTTQQPPSSGFGGFGGFGQQQTSQQPGQQTQQPAQTGGLFGSQPPASSTTGTGFGGFGQSQPQPLQQQQPQQSQQPATSNSALGFGLGGGSTANTTGAFGSTIGGGLAGTGGPNNSQQPQQSLTRTTKYNDLSDAHKKVIDDIDAHIQGRNHIALNLKSEPLGKDVDRSSVLLEQVSNDLMSLKSTLSHTSAALDSLKEDTDTDTVRALTMTRIIDGYKRPQESGAWLKTYRDFPHEYFTQMSVDLKDRATKYTSTLEQIERHLRYLLSTISQQQAMYTPHSIAQILQTQHSTFMSLASHVAELQSATEGLKEGYRDIWRNKTKSYADPFTLPNEGA
ncbi:hypothetical protein E3P91_02296 [Wallemia ichthyophaga]|nr:hypothetical protein E3P91_02296 [Wallemia ichthyophaga]